MMRRVWMALSGLVLWLGVARASEVLPMFAGVPDGAAMASVVPESPVALLYISHTELDSSCGGMERVLQEMKRQKLLDHKATALLQRVERGLSDFRKELQSLSFAQVLVAVGTTDCKEVEWVVALRFRQSVSDVQLQRSILQVMPELQGALEIRTQGVQVKGECVLPLHWREGRRVLVLGAASGVPKALRRMEARQAVRLPEAAHRLLGRAGFQLLFVNQPCLQRLAAGLPQLSREALGFHLPLAAVLSSDAMKTRLQLEFGEEADARKVSDICENLAQMAIALVEKLKTAPLLDEKYIAPYKPLILQTLQGVRGISSHAEGTCAVVELGEGGGIVYAMVPVGAAIVLPALSAARAKARSISCVSNVKQMLLGCALFADDHDECLPASSEWEAAMKKYGVGQEALRCPGAGRYRYFGGGWKTGEIPKPAATVMLADEIAHEHVYVVGFADGHVLTIPRVGSLEESVKKAGYVLLQPKDVK